MTPEASSRAWYFELSLLRLVNTADRDSRKGGPQGERKRHLESECLACAQALTKLPGVNFLIF